MTATYPHPVPGTVYLPGVVLASPSPATDLQEMSIGELQYTRLVLVHELSGLVDPGTVAYDAVIRDYRAVRGEIYSRSRTISV